MVMKKSRKRISLRSLSPARQDLIVCMHQKQSGTIRNLPVVAGEPMLSDARVTRRRNLGTKSPAPPVSRNFNLKVAQLDLLQTLDEIEDGKLDLIIFEDGLPCELEQCSA